MYPKWKKRVESLTRSQDAIPVSGLREFVFEFFAGGLQLFVVAGHQSHVEDLTFT